MIEPLISIIIPTYNRADLITRTLDSVVNQTFIDFEVLIIDDGSTDSTESVIEAITDPRFSYYKKINEERGKARNYGIERAKGQYITFLDSDDLIYPKHLALAKKEIENNTAVFWLPYEEIDSTGKVIEHYHNSGNTIAYDLVHKGNILSCHGMFLHREILLAQKFNEDRKLSGSEDMELWLRISARHSIKRLDQVSNVLVHHSERSVFNFDNIEKLIQRKELMLKYLEADNTVMEQYGAELNIIHSRAYSYIALHALLNRSNPKGTSWIYFIRSIKRDPSSLISKRSLTIFKHTIQRLVSTK